MGRIVLTQTHLIYGLLFAMHDKRVLDADDSLVSCLFQKSSPYIMQ